MVSFDSFMMLANVLFIFLLLMVILPSIVIPFEPGDDGILDRLFLPLIHASVFIIFTVYLLSALKLFETLSLIMVSVLAFIFFWRRKYARKQASPGIRMIVGIYDMSEDWEGFFSKIQKFFKTAAWKIKHSVVHLVSEIARHPFALLCIIASLGFAAYIRFHHSVLHYYFGASDTYVHMQWAKSLDENKVFVDGVYPLGLECVMAALNRFFMMDMYTIVRFLGAINGMLIVLSIGYALKKLGANLYGVFIAIFFYSVYSLLPTGVWRQLSTISMEFGMIFFLPGLAFWMLFCKNGKRRHLLLSSECLMLTLLVHPYVMVILLIGIAITGLYYVRRVWARGEFWTALLYLAGGLLLGGVPPLVGLISGIPFFSSSLGYVQDNLGAVAPRTRLPLEQQLLAWATPWHIAAWAIGAMLTVIYFWRRKKLTRPAVGFPVLLIVYLVFLIMDYADALGLPTLLPLDRWGMLFSLFIAFFYGAILMTIDRIFDRGLKRSYVSIAVSLLAAVIVVGSGHIVPMQYGARYEYDAAVQNLLKIRSQFTVGNWTIVAPVEEFPLVRAYGYHTELWEFIRDTEPGSPKKADSAAKFPTANVFFYMEKVPLYQAKPQPITPAEAARPFPMNVKKLDATDYYYRSANRITLEAKMYNWAEWYMRTHPDKMTVYYNSPKFEVFHLVQQAQQNPPPLPGLPQNEQGKW